MALQPFVGPWPRFQFLDLFYIIGRTPWTGDQPVARPLPAHTTAQKQNKRTQTSMARVGFEPRIPVLERANTVHASDRAATVIGTCTVGNLILSNLAIKLISVYKTFHLNAISNHAHHLS
jgi:hypothetical protein